MSAGPDLSGALRFARFAHPPNELGHCGPDHRHELLERVHTATVDPGLAQLARGFDGAWPYLELLAGAVGGEPLDDDVVEAYWIGNRLLDRVTTGDLGRSMEDRFRIRAGGQWRHLERGIDARGVPHHSFHVLCVYPWVGLLRSDATGPALEVLQQCCIRVARVVEVDGATAVARSRPLTWDGRRLAIGPATAETVTVSRAGQQLVHVGPGALVALHWGWVCDRLTDEQARRLTTVTSRHIGLANQHLTADGAAALGAPNVTR